MFTDIFKECTASIFTAEEYAKQAASEPRVEKLVQIFEHKGSGDLEKRKFLTLPELELRPFSRPARSQSLYRLR
jgi:hypothetical protein